MGDKRYFFSKEKSDTRTNRGAREKVRREGSKRAVRISFLGFSRGEDPARGPPMDPKTRIYAASEARAARRDSDGSWDSMGTKERWFMRWKACLLFR